MNKTTRISKIIEDIANKSGLDTKNINFLDNVKLSVYNNFLNDDAKVPGWLVHALEAVLDKKGFPQTQFIEDKNEGDVDNFMHSISEILCSTVDDEGEIYSIDFSALSMQIIVMRMGHTYEVVNYN